MKTSAPDIRNSDVNEAINQAFEVASPECFSTAQSGTTGMAITASVDVPEEIKFASGIVMVETREAHNLEVAGSNPVPATSLVPVIHEIESLSEFSDEGETGWNAQGRADIARKMQRIAAGGYNSVDRVIETVEAVTA